MRTEGSGSTGFAHVHKGAENSFNKTNGVVWEVMPVALVRAEVSEEHDPATLGDAIPH
jgi:hypothetical protein